MLIWRQGGAAAAASAVDRQAPIVKLNAIPPPPDDCQGR
jgi:hypothetical protein